MRPGEKSGSIVFENDEEIHIACHTLDVRSREVDRETARDIWLVEELLDDASTGVSLAVVPSRLILSSFESAMFNPDYPDARVRQQAGEIYEDYRQKAIAENKL